MLTPFLKGLFLLKTVKSVRLRSLQIREHSNFALYKEKSFKKSPGRRFEFDNIFSETVFFFVTAITSLIIFYVYFLIIRFLN